MPKILEFYQRRGDAPPFPIFHLHVDQALTLVQAASLMKLALDVVYAAAYYAPEDPVGKFYGSLELEIAFKPLQD